MSAKYIKKKKGTKRHSQIEREQKKNNLSLLQLEPTQSTKSKRDIESFSMYKLTWNKITKKWVFQCLSWVLFVFKHSLVSFLPNCPKKCKGKLFSKPSYDFSQQRDHANLKKCLQIEERTQVMLSIENKSWNSALTTAQWLRMWYIVSSSYLQRTHLFANAHPLF